MSRLAAHTGPPPRPEPAHTTGRAPFRTDIEGLRAVAVLLVVASHLGWWPHGGFIGVDVFFVISGFLITGLVVDEISRTGRLSFRGFYLRRARRILPASLTVLLATWVAAKLVFAGERVTDTVHDIWWSLGFAANIRFATSGTDYFDAFAAPSLVQHYWSLAVEEQFYVVWPVLLLAVTLAARRLAPRRAGWWVLAAASVAVVASFAWGVHSTATSPSSAYFSTPGRAWELGVGAVIALAARRGIRVPARWAGPVSLTGVAGIVAAAVVLDDGSSLPGPSAALPVLATALVLAAGTGIPGFSSPWFAVLTNPVSRFVGRISFSLYLWHWPTILVVEALVPRDSWLSFPLTISAMAALSVMSYYGIEETFRHRTPRAAEPTSEGRHSSRRTARTPWGPRLGVVVALCACTLGLWQLRPDGPRPTKVAAASLETDLGPHTTALQREIAAALAAREWPELSPSLADEISGKTTPDDECGEPSQTVAPADICTHGSPTAPKLALVVGDSAGHAYMEVLKRVVATTDGTWQVRFIGMNGCPFIDVETRNIQEILDTCPAHKQASLDLINRLRPDMVIVANVSGRQHDVVTDKKLTLHQQIDGLDRYLDRIRASTPQLVVLDSPAYDTHVDVVSCYTNVSVPADCITPVTAGYRAFADLTRRLATKYQAVYIDPVPWFCVDGSCPAFVGTVATKKDLVHMTRAYAKRIAPAVTESFAANDLFTP